MSKNNFIVVSLDMIEELNLKGNELIIYSIISSFSKDGDSDFHGSLLYLQKWTKSSKQTVLTALDSLISKGLITKEKVGKFCHYRIVINENTKQTSIDDFPVDDFPKEKPAKKTNGFSKADYTECVRLIESNRAKLRERHINIDETKFPIATMNSWLKKKFTVYGIEETKKGIINSINNEWLVKSARYSLTALFSDKIFPKCVEGKFTTPVTNNKHSKIGLHYA